MGNQKLSNLTEQTTELKEDDLLYIAASGSTSKKIKGNKIIPSVLTQNITGTIDLNNYKGDVIIFSTPTSNITITLNNTLPSGRLITITNKSSSYTITLAGGSTEQISPNDSLTLISDGSALYKNAIDISEKDNLLINGNFRFAQRGSSGSALFTAASSIVNNDDTYLLDQWLLLSDGNDIVDVSQDSDIPNKIGLSMKSTVQTINKKFGFLQPLRNQDVSRLQDEKVSLSFYAKTTSAKLINNIRAAVISWDGTADDITSDIVSTWNASGADPTLVSNWTYENTPSDLALSTSWQQFKIENILVDTVGMKNLAVFIWVDDTDAAVGDELFLAQSSLNEGSFVTPIKYRSFDDEYVLCQNFFQKSYDIDIEPGNTSANGRVFFGTTTTNASSTYTVIFPVIFPIKLFRSGKTTPINITTFDSAGASNKVDVVSGSVTPIISNTNEHSSVVRGDHSGASTISRTIEFHYIIDGVL
jgi:hypothetical protein